MATRTMFRLVLVVAVTTVFISSTSSSPDVCDYLNIDGVHPARDPLEPYHGKVVVVVLGRASRYASHQLVKKLESSIREMRLLGMVETALVVITEKELGNHIANWRKRLRIAQLLTDNIDRTLFKAFGGRTNDVLIYDRCGRMTYFLPYQRKTARMITERVNLISKAIVATYTSNLCSETCRKAKLVEEKPDPLEELLNNAIDVTVAPVTAEPKLTTAKLPSTVPPPPTPTKPTSIMGYVWTYVKSIFTLKSKTDEEEIVATPTTKPSNEDKRRNKTNSNIMSKQEACDRLGPDPCETSNGSSDTKEQDAFCCSDAIQDEMVKEKCNHTEECCNRFLLRQLCCSEPVLKPLL